MPFDAIVTRSIVKELSDMLVGGRVDKIYQPFCDEIIINARSRGDNVRLLLTINQSRPGIYITKVSRDNPKNAPLFSMLLRKHLMGGKILSIKCDDFERIVTLEVESQTELGDVLKKRLVIEIMGKHSNIILVNHENKIIDSIKHVDSSMSSVREIMPARPYVVPPTKDKTVPTDVSIETMLESIDMPLERCMLDRIKGFSPYIIRKICTNAKVSSDASVSELSGDDISRIKKNFGDVVDNIKKNNFSPCIEYDGERACDFYCMDFGGNNIKRIKSMNECVDLFYQEKDRLNRLNTAKSNVMKIVNTNINRCSKKIRIKEKEISDATTNMRAKLYGDLIIANLYRMKNNEDSVMLKNFFSEEQEIVKIPLDPKLTPNDNAQRYYKRYRKAKTTLELQTDELAKTKEEFEYLEGIRHTIDNATEIEDVDDIRDELQDGGYITNVYSSYSKRTKPSVSMPRKFVTKEGYVIAVGKNNRQNEELTLRWASPHDMWLHVRGGQGSHVVIRTDKREVPMDVIYKAAKLAAYYSKEREAGVVEVDYTYVKHVRKLKKDKPGKVIYYNSKTVSVKAEIDDTLTKE